MSCHFSFVFKQLKHKFLYTFNEFLDFILYLSLIAALAMIYQTYLTIMIISYLIFFKQDYC